MKRENFYRRDPGLALAGMAGMSLEERGVYNTIIDLLYLTWRPVEDNAAYIAGHCGCAVQKLNPILRRLIEIDKLVRFVEGGRSYISNDKFEEERTDVKGTATTRSGRAQVRQKSAGVEEKSAGVEKTPPTCSDESEEIQPSEHLEKSRVDKTSANALFVVEAAPTPTIASKAKPKTREYPADMEAAWKAYPHHDGRSSKPNTLAQWKILPDEERAGMLAAIAAFRPKVAEVCGGRGAPCMARWLKDGKHLNWMGMGRGAVPLLDAVKFPNTAIRDAVVQAKGEPFAISYIDRCRFEERDGVKTILCPSERVAKLLREEVPMLERRKAQIIVEPPSEGGSVHPFPARSVA